MIPESLQEIYDNIPFELKCTPCTRGFRDVGFILTYLALGDGVASIAEISKACFVWKLQWAEGDEYVSPVSLSMFKQYHNWNKGGKCELERETYNGRCIIMNYDNDCWLDPKEMVIALTAKGVKAAAKYVKKLVKNASV